MERQVKFIVIIGYSNIDIKEFEFNNVEEAIHFAVTAKKTAKYSENVKIEIEFAKTATADKEEE